MGVCIEPPAYVVGLKLFEQDVFRTKPQGVRSEHGDTDRTVYSARKFCRLALSGNPSILTLLYAKPDVYDSYGWSLLDLAPAFSARSAGKAFLGYMTQQRQRLLGERGQMNVKRPELVEKHGYDTKHAMHLWRLLRMCAEILETGRVLVRRPDADELLAIRDGAWRYDAIIALGVVIRGGRMPEGTGTGTGTSAGT